MNQRLIVIDGKTYKSVDEMPEDVRRKYEAAMRNFDKNNNGVPDMLENANPFADQNKDGMPDMLEGMASFQGSIGNVMSSTKIIVNGQAYDSVDQLPPDVRAKYEQALGSMDKNRNGIPDFIEGMIKPQASSQASINAPAGFDIASPDHASSPFHAKDKPRLINHSTIEPESSGGWMFALAGIMLAGLCLVAAAAGVWYFYFR